MSGNSFVDGSIHTSETVTFTCAWQYADNYNRHQENAVDAYFTIAPGTFDDRYRMWRLSLDVASFGIPEPNSLDPEHQFSVLFSPARRGTAFAGYGANGLRSAEQVIMNVRQWGNQQTSPGGGGGNEPVYNTVIETTNIVVENLNSRTIRLRCVNPSISINETIDGAANPIWLDGGGAASFNYFTYTFSATPILEPLMH